MKKIKILSLLFVCLSIFLSACGDDDTPVPVTVKTVLMYLVGDNERSYVSWYICNLLGWWQ